MDKKIIKIEAFGDLLLFILLYIAIVFILTVFYMWILHVTLVPLFGFSMPSFWQFLGLEILANVFFKSHGFEDGLITFKEVNSNGKDSDIT